MVWLLGCAVRGGQEPSLGGVHRGLQLPGAELKVSERWHAAQELAFSEPLAKVGARGFPCPHGQ